MKLADLMLTDEQRRKVLPAMWDMKDLERAAIAHAVLKMEQKHLLYHPLIHDDCCTNCAILAEARKVVSNG